LGKGATPKERKLRNPQRHRERCRAIAQLKWKNDPDIPLKTMIQDPEIKEVGLESDLYYEATLLDWIKDLDPKGPPKRGRPPKKAVVDQGKKGEIEPD